MVISVLMFLAKGRLSVATVILVCGAYSDVSAQSEGFDVDRFQSAPSVLDGLAIQRPETPGHLQWSLGAQFGYVSSPLGSKLRTSEGGTYEVVSGHLAGQLVFSLGVFERLELNASWSGDFSQSGDDGADIGLDLPMTTSSGLGDLGLGGKYRFYESGPWDLAVTSAISLPTGAQSAFTGDGGVGARGSLSTAYRLSKVTLAMQTGIAYRPDNRFALLQVGSELFWRGGVHMPVGESLRLMLEVDSRTDLHDNRILTRGGTPTEGLLGARVRVGGGFYLGGLLGVGLMNASGEPNARVLASLTWSASKSQGQSEVILDSDEVVVERETASGESDGPEAIMAEPESDPVDVSEPTEDLALDVTPQDGSASQPTVPAPSRPSLSLDDAKAGMPAALSFSVGKTLMSRETRRRLDALAKFLNDNPEIDSVEIRGHASAEGSPSYNESLSLKRAEVVRKYLASKNVAASRMSVFGAGENEPIAGNDSEQERRLNRRVEIRVLNVQ